MAASKAFFPCSCCCLANSTISTAFLADSPASTTKPICVKMLLSMCRSQTPAMPHSRHIGTIRMMAEESAKLSYSAEWVSKTNRMHSGKMNSAVLPAAFSWKASSVHS